MMVRDTINTTAATTRPDNSGPESGRRVSFLIYALLFSASLLAGPMLYGAARPWGLGVAAALMAAAWLTVLVRRPWRAPWVWTGSSVDLWIGLAVIAALSAALLSSIPSQSVLDLLRGASCLGAYYGVLRFCRGREEARRFCQVLTLFGGLLSGIGLAQLAGGLPREWWHRADLLSATYVNHNHFAGFLELVLPLGLVMAIYERDAAKKAIYIFSCLLMMTAFVFTLSRAGLASMAVGLVIFFRALHRRGFMLTVVPFAAFTALLVAAILAFGTEPIQERFKDTQKIEEGSELSFQYRLLTWQGAVDLAKQAPVTGMGPGAFGHRYLPVRPVTSSFRPVHAHNDYLQIAVETGFAGLILLLMPVLILMVIAWKRLVEYESRFRSAIAAASLTGLASFMIHGLADFNWHIPANAVLACALAGLLASQSARRERVMKPAYRWPLAVSVLAAGLWAVASGYSDALLQDSERAFRRGSYAEAWASAEESVRWNPLNAEAYYRRALARSILRASSNTAELAASAAASRRDLERAAQLNPYEPYYDLRHGTFLLGLGSDPQTVVEAVRYLDRAAAKDPLNPQLYFMAGRSLASVVAQEPRWRLDLERFLGRAVDLDPSMASSVYRLLGRQARYAMGDLLRFHRDHPKGLQGWLEYLERSELWKYHRSFLMESLPARPAVSAGGGWIEVPSSRLPFEEHLSESKEIDLEIGQSYTFGGLVHIPERTSRVKITAKGSPAFKAYPYVYVRLDGNIVDSVYVDSAEFKDYFALLPPGSGGSHTLILHYANDRTDRASGRHRNLWVRDVVLEVLREDNKGAAA